MLDMMKRIRSGPAPKGDSGDFMSRMTSLPPLVSNVELLQGHYTISVNLQGKKVSRTQSDGRDVMSEMAKLLVSNAKLLQGHNIISINGC